LQDFLFSLNIVLPILLLILLGMALSKLKLTNQLFIDTANKISFRVFLPILLFYSIVSVDFFDVFDGRLIAFIMIAAMALFLILILAVPLIVKDNARKSVIIQGLFRANFVIFGIPISYGIAGSDGQAVAAMVTVFLVPLFNILMVIVLDYYSGDGKKHSVWHYTVSILKNPFIVAGLTAIAFVTLRYFMPVINMPTALNDIIASMLKAIYDFLAYISRMATPLALILLGMEFSGKSALKNIKAVTIVTILRTIIIPLAVVAIAIAFGFRNVQLAVILTAFAAPAAVTGFVMAKNAKADYNLAGEIIVGTTLFCILTMFVFIFAGKRLGLI